MLGSRLLQRGAARGKQRGEPRFVFYGGHYRATPKWTRENARGAPPQGLPPSCYIRSSSLSRWALPLFASPRLTM